MAQMHYRTAGKSSSLKQEYGSCEMISSRHAESYCGNSCHSKGQRFSEVSEEFQEVKNIDQSVIVEIKGTAIT